VKWHCLTIEAVLTRLNVTSAGLATAEAIKRRLQSGPNELQASHSVSAFDLLLTQFKNVMIIILLVTTVLSAFLGHNSEAVAIGVIVLFAVLLGSIQEYRAERAIDALRKMAAPTATVLRDGVEVELPASELVPGDMILVNRCCCGRGSSYIRQHQKIPDVSALS